MDLGAELAPLQLDQRLPAATVETRIGLPGRFPYAKLTGVTQATASGATPGRPASAPACALPDVAMMLFYGHVFAAAPEIRAMFPAAMGSQPRRFHRALAGGPSGGYLESLGRSHRKYGVRKEHYLAFRAALRATCRRFGLRAADEAAVLASFDRAAAIMIAAADADAVAAPAWWTAQVTGHDLAAPDIAVLTLRPDRRMAYLPGQHAWVQTPRWPRQWRRYSLASAPRPDGTLTLHVRAVPAGLVSSALVYHTRPGDTVLLGRAEGTMTADTRSSRDVLCLGGGTGMAPLMAIAEVLAATNGAAFAGLGSRREIVVYHGARTIKGLYALPALRRMAASYPGVAVIPATSADNARQALGGTIPDLATRAPWRDRDIYIAGPEPMIIATVRALLAVGADPGQLHYDLPFALLRH
jgi:NAD(P)H-flavin reductase